MKDKRDLLSDDGGDVDSLRMRVNREYADHFESRKRKQEIAKLKAKGVRSKSDEECSDSESHSSSSEDEYGVLDVPEWGDDFLRIVPAIVKKKKEIYDPNVTFFKERADYNESGKGKDDIGGEKPLLLGQYIADSIMKETADELVEKKNKAEITPREQQMKYKMDFINAASFGDEDDDKSILRKKEKTGDEIAIENIEYEKFKLEHPVEKEEIDEIRSFWKGDKVVSSDEKYLLEYFLKKKWIGKGGEARGRIRQHEDEEPEDDDEELEEFDDKQDLFESRYNFRHEEEGAHMDSERPLPRFVPQSIRAAPSKQRRKKKHISKDSQINRSLDWSGEGTEQKSDKKAERDRLRELEREETESRLSILRSEAGFEAFSVQDLEADFDPLTHDQKLAKVFEFHNNKLDMDIDQQSDDNDDVLLEASSKVIETSDDPKKTGQRRPFNKLSTKAREKVSKNQLQINDYFQEFYEKLPHEDLIDGEIKCHFPYLKVKKEDFGLSVEEILTLDDKELSKRVSMKQYAPFQAMYPRKKLKLEDIEEIERIEEAKINEGGKKRSLRQRKKRTRKNRKKRRT